MNGHLFAGFVVAALVIQLVPGPGMLFLIVTAVGRGPRAGLAAAFGAATGVAVQTVAAAFGLAALFHAVPAALEALKLAGAGYLLWLAFHAFRSGDSAVDGDGADHPQVSPLRVAARSLVNNLTNPKIALFVVGFLPAFVDRSRGHVAGQLLVPGFCLVLVGLGVDIVIGMSAGRAGDLLRRRPRLGIGLNRIAGVVYGGLAVASVGSE